MKNVLFCWVGHADLTGMNSNQTKGIRELVESTTGKKTLEQSSDGPVKVALSQRPFDRVILLWSYADRRLIPEFKHYLNFDAEIYPNFLENPSDYTAVYKTELTRMAVFKLCTYKSRIAITKSGNFFKKLSVSEKCNGAFLFICFFTVSSAIGY